MDRKIPLLGAGLNGREPRNLQERIAAGLADPISEREREQLEELRMIYIDRFGKDPRDS